MVTINFVSIALGVHCFVLYILVKIMGVFFCVHFNRSKTKIQNQMLAYIFFCF